MEGLRMRKSQVALPLTMFTAHQSFVSNKISENTLLNGKTLFAMLQYCQKASMAFAQTLIGPYLCKSFRPRSVQIKKNDNDFDKCFKVCSEISKSQSFYFSLLILVIIINFISHLCIYSYIFLIRNMQEQHLCVVKQRGLQQPPQG